jgi:hypothetical protein
LPHSRKLPADREVAQRLAHRAKSFVIIEGELYKKSPTRVLQRCIPIERGRELLRDIHAGAYGHYVSLRTLIRKAF